MVSLSYYHTSSYTITAIKADVGSIAGHTRPSLEMLIVVDRTLKDAARNNHIIDYRIMHTGDDIAMLMTHYGNKRDPTLSLIDETAYRLGFLSSAAILYVSVGK